MRFPNAAERDCRECETAPMLHFVRPIGLFAKPLVSADVSDLARCSSLASCLIAAKRLGDETRSANCV